MTRLKQAVLILLCLLIAGALAAGVALLAFRPQLTDLYYRLRQAQLMRTDPAYRQYRDTDGNTVIWLDPGHGGTDPGATSSFLGEETEASVNLRLSLLVKERLEAYGYTVRMAWTEADPPAADGSYPYPDRIARANADPEADLYVCLHCNSFSDPSVSGARLYYFPDPDPYTHPLAVSVATAIGQAHGETAPRLFPQTADNAFYVLRHATMPAFLLETLFVSHPGDAAKLLDPTWLETEADGIAAGLRAFIGS